MDDKPIPKIVEAERTSRGLLITFEDGKQALYSNVLLHQLYHVADILSEDMPDAE
jgi:hypothetical protein